MKTKHTSKVWYVASIGNHQGLIIDEITGENIAVSYNKANALVMAAGPELLEALQAILIQFGYWKQQDKETSGYRWAVKAERAIREAVEGEEEV